MMSLVELEKTIVECKKCERLVDFREKIAREKRRSYIDWDYWGKAVPGYGEPDAKFLILGLAPAAHGGNRTGRVFTGDKSADFLFRSKQSWILVTAEKKPPRLWYWHQLIPRRILNVQL